MAEGELQSDEWYVERAFEEGGVELFTVVHADNFVYVFLSVMCFTFVYISVLNLSKGCVL